MLKGVQCVALVPQTSIYVFPLPLYSHGIRLSDVNYGNMVIKPYLLHCFIQHIIEKRLLESGMGYTSTYMYMCIRQ